MKKVFLLIVLLISLGSQINANTSNQTPILLGGVGLLGLLTSGGLLLYNKPGKLTIEKIKKSPTLLGLCALGGVSLGAFLSAIWIKTQNGKVNDVSLRMAAVKAVESNPLMQGLLRQQQQGQGVTQ